jgi:hypothetical protein
MADSMFGIDAMGGGAGSIEEAHHHLNAIDPEITAVHLGFTLITMCAPCLGWWGMMLIDVQLRHRLWYRIRCGTSFATS